MTSSTSVPSTALYGGTSTRRITVRDIARAKHDGERWPMLTAYDALTARVFDQSGIPVLLVGDSAAMVVYGYDSTVTVTVDELLPLSAAVARSTTRALVVADLPFGTYQGSTSQALDTAARFMKEGGAHAVKLEGGHRITEQVETLVTSGIPVMGHIGLTPQSVHTLGGYRVQGRGDAAAGLLSDAKELERAGAFAVVLECVPAQLAADITAQLGIATIGIGAGAKTDAQVLVWQDMAGLSPDVAKFVKTYANLTETLSEAARTYAEDVVAGDFPDEEHSYT